MTRAVRGSMKIPTFQASLVLEPLVTGKGMCIHRSVALVLDIPRFVLCAGTFRAATPEEIIQVRRETGQEPSKVPFIHVWCEMGENAVIAPTTFERWGNKLIPMRKDEYYELNGIRDVHRMNRAKLLKLSKEYGLRNHIMKQTPLKGGASFGFTILDNMGVQYTVGDDGGLVPK